ncbi:MAG: baseplate J/gp47 family protein, partial [Chloroflexota bacterium]|nr:baseplate J/gp47 family protein [Chloroflexota bacterium]
LDATEPLGPARRAAIVAAERKDLSRVRAAAVLATLLVAALVLGAVVAPTATIVVAPVSQALGPLEYDLRAGPNNADINAVTLGPTNITTKVMGTATGSRTDETKAKGIERFTNQTTSDIRIPKGTVVKTADGIAFATTSDQTLPKSAIVIFPPSVIFGAVDITIEAVDLGPRGNVDARKITQSASPGQYSVENPIATSGGDSKKIPIVQLSDYDLAVSRSEAELRKQGDTQTEAWKKQAAQGQTVYGVVVKRTSITPAQDVVGKELSADTPTFELSVAGTATGYSVPSDEPRKTTAERLATAADSGYDIDKDGAVVEIVGAPTVEADGVHWRVRGRASQFRRFDEAAVKAALAGRGFEEVDAVVADRGLRLVRVSTWPGWWPRLPVLDARIAIQKDAPAARVP